MFLDKVLQIPSLVIAPKLRGILESITYSNGGGGSVASSYGQEPGTVTVAHAQNSSRFLPPIRSFATPLEGPLKDVVFGVPDDLLPKKRRD